MNNQLTLLLTRELYNSMPELRGYFTLKSLLHSGLKQVMSLFTLGSARAFLVVAFNVIMTLISPYTNQPFIVPIRQTSIAS
jgi:hypothetical protein